MTVLVVGDVHRPEFDQARASFDAAGEVVYVPHAQAAAELLSREPLVPEVIVLAQAYPGEFDAAQIEHLRRWAPLARIVGLLGSWCEGELRTGRPLPGVLRVYWHQWTARWQQELQRLRDGRCPTWGLPPTATEEERLLAEADERLPARHGLVIVLAYVPTMGESLAATCRTLGYATVCLHPAWPARVDGAVAVLFDATDGSGAECDDLARLAVSLDPSPIVALVNFPRIEDCQRLAAAGAAAILSKPVLLEDLDWQLAHVADRFARRAI